MQTRPKRPSAEQTRQKILHAAKDIFLEKGFDACSIREIAKIAGVNTNLIFHHFTNKQILWNKVKDYVLGEELPKPKYKTSTAKSFFKSILDFRFDIYSNHPEFAKLIKWEPLTKQEHELVSQQDYSPTHWLPIIKDMQKQGKIVKTASAEQIMLFIIFSSHAPFWQNIFPLDTKQTKKYKKMLLNMCCNEFAIEEENV